MQPQPLRPTDSVSAAPRSSVRPGAVLHPADRSMLQAVRDTLSHVRRPAATFISASQRHDVDMPPVQNSSYVTGESMTLTAGQNSSRLYYNKKAMDEIRQSLQNYHVTPSYDSSTVAVTTHLANGSSGGIATSAGDNMVRQVVLLGANEARNTHAHACVHAAYRILELFTEFCSVREINCPRFLCLTAGVMLCVCVKDATLELSLSGSQMCINP